MREGAARAICIRCGAERADYREICHQCGHRPDGEGLLVAWLLSEAHLGRDQMAQAARRLRDGEAIRPSERMLDVARRALGAHLQSDPGLSLAQRMALLVTSVLITPLPGFVLWLWWRQERPRAALQALGLSLPAFVMVNALLLWISR